MKGYMARSPSERNGTPLARLAGMAATILVIVLCTMFFATLVTSAATVAKHLYDQAHGHTA
jgi:hypothetical protein